MACFALRPSYWVVRLLVILPSKMVMVIFMHGKARIRFKVKITAAIKASTSCTPDNVTSVLAVSGNFIQ